MNTKKKNQASPVLLKEYEEKRLSLPFPSSTEKKKIAQHSLQKAKEEKLWLFPWVDHAHSVHNVTEFSFIHLGETFTLAVSPEIYNTVIKE